MDLLTDGRLIVEPTFELCPAYVHQKVADVAISLPGIVRPGQVNGQACYLNFGGFRASRQLLDRCTVAVASSKIHLRVDPRRIFQQNTLDCARLLEHLAPISLS